MVMNKQEFIRIVGCIKELDSLLFSRQLLQSDQVRTAMKKLRDEMDTALRNTETMRYEELSVGDFYLDPKGVRKRKIKFDLDIGSVPVDPGHSGLVSCPAPSKLVRRILE